MSVQYIGSIQIANVFPNVDAFVKKVNDLIAAFATFKVAFSGISGTLTAVLDVLVLLEGGLDFVLNASFGLGALKLSAMLEFQGALRAMGHLSIAISNPLAQAALAITAMLQATASLQVSLSLGLPTVSADLGFQLSAIAAVSAAAAAKMAGIQAVIDASLSLLGPLVDVKYVIDGLTLELSAMLAPLEASFNLLPLEIMLHLGNATPGVHLYTVDCLASALHTELASITPPIASGANVKAVLMMVDSTSQPLVWGDLSFMVRTTP